MFRFINNINYLFISALIIGVLLVSQELFQNKSSNQYLRQQKEFYRLQGRYYTGIQSVVNDVDPYGLESITGGDYDSEGNWIHEWI